MLHLVIAAVVVALAAATIGGMIWLGRRRQR